MDWTPTISDRQGPLYHRIVNALAEDIAAGRLRHGQALPTHRALARALGVDLTTVTRAYTEARRQGLTAARVGAGTFVRAAAPASQRVPVSPGIDLSMNLPPQPGAADLDGRFAEALGALRAEQGLAPYMTYQQPGGTLAERQIAALWLSPVVPGLPAERLLIAPGTQAALFALLMMLAKPGGVVLAERLTYPGLKAAAAAAAVAGVGLAGVDMDGEGMIPDALDRAAREHAADVVYLVPTIHNPTTVTMSPQRRAAIADVVRTRGLTLIEDDPHAFLVPGTVPIATLVPEQVYLTMSLSKCIAPGLRTSLVVVPERSAGQRLASLLRAMMQMPAPLMTAVATRWMRDGEANAIIEAVRAEAKARQTLARDALRGLDYASNPAGHHVWLPLPEHWPAARFAVALERRGLAVVTADAFAIDGKAPNAVRLALGAARSRGHLSSALEIVRETLGAPAADFGLV
jgi:DNA-binding transcriptional MocR family regulator